MDKKSIIISIVVALLVGAVSFYGGTLYQKSQRGNNQFRNQFANRFGNNGANANIRPVRGEILNSDDSSITVKMSDGSSKIVLLSNSTQILEATATSKQALKTGQTVNVFGTQNSDGSLTAQSVQLNPQNGLGFNRTNR